MSLDQKSQQMLLISLWVFWGFLKQIISLSLTPSPCLNQASTVKSSLLLRDFLFLLLPVISISISPLLSNTSSIFYLSRNHRNLISICSPSAVLLICLFLNLSIQLNTSIKCMSTISNSYWNLAPPVAAYVGCKASHCIFSNCATNRRLGCYICRYHSSH